MVNQIHRNDQVSRSFDSLETNLQAPRASRMVVDTISASGQRQNAAPITKKVISFVKSFFYPLFHPIKFCQTAFAKVSNFVSGVLSLKTFVGEVETSFEEDKSKLEEEIQELQDKLKEDDLEEDNQYLLQFDLYYALHDKIDLITERLQNPLNAAIRLRLETELTECRSDLTALSSELLPSLKTLLKAKKELKILIDNKIEQIHESLRHMPERKEELRAQIAQLREDKKGYQSILDDQTRALEHAQAQTDLDEADEHIEERNRSLENLGMEKDSLYQDIETLEAVDLSFPTNADELKVACRPEVFRRDPATRVQVEGIIARVTS